MEQPFEVQIVGHVPGLMRAENDLDAAGLARFRGGLERLSYVLRTQCKAENVRFFAVHRSGTAPLNSKPMPSSRDSSGDWYTYQPDIKSVADLGLGLLCHYDRLADPEVQAIAPE